MASDGYVSRLNSVEYAARHERLLDSVLQLPAGTGPFSARGGRRVHGAGLQTSVSGSPEQITVTAGSGIVSPGSGSTGAYSFAIPASVNLPLPARPSTGLSRIDLVVARIYDVDETLGSTREVKIEHVAGTPSGSPSAPAQPPMSLLLATLTVPSSGTIPVTQSTARTVAAGGVLPVATTAERDALTAYEGMVVFNAQTGILEHYDGTAWQGGKPPWQTLPLISPATPNSFGYTPAFRVWPDGRVDMRGIIAATLGTSGTVNVATLPTDARPGARQQFAAAVNLIGSPPPVARIEITTTGVVGVICGGTARDWVCLDGISFDRT